MIVLLTGATGYVGRGLLRALGAAGHVARCLIRPGSEGRLRSHYPQVLELAAGDVLDLAAVKRAAQGCQAAIHLVGIIRERPARGVTFERLHVEASRNLVRACEEVGVQRYLHMSALGARPAAPTQYFKTKFRAEEIVRASGLRWTIFRPSVIYGRGRGTVNFVNQLHDLMALGGVIPMPIIPVIGDGRSRLQPIHLDQLAAGMVRALEAAGTELQTYEVGGPEPIAYEQILRAIERHTRRYRLHFKLPVAWIKPLVALLERWPAFPLTSDQLVMLQEGSVCDPKPFFEAFKLTPVSFEVGLASHF